MHLHIYTPMLLTLFGTSGSNQIEVFARPSGQNHITPRVLSVLILSVLTSRVPFRSFAPRGTNHNSQHHHPQNSLLPTPPLLSLPRPPFRPPVGGPVSNRRYQWGAPEPDSHWRRPPRQDSWPRYPPAEPDRSPYSWRQKDRRRGPPPPDNHYSPHWTNDSNGHDAPKRMGSGSKKRHNHR